MKKWNLIQNQPLYSVKFLKNHQLDGANFKGQHTVSRRYRCAACYTLQLFIKYNLRIQKARVDVFLCIQLTILNPFFVPCNQQGIQIRICDETCMHHIAFYIWLLKRYKMSWACMYKNFGGSQGTVMGKQIIFKVGKR